VINLVAVDPRQRLRLIGAVRAVTNSSLLEARALVDSLPKRVMEVESLTEASLIRKRLEEAGGVVSPEGAAEENRGEHEVTLSGGDPGMVVIGSSGEGLRVCVYGVRWEGPHTPVANHRPLAEWSWSQLPADPAERFSLVRAAVQEAIRVRRSEFRNCRYCTAPNPPEWMHAEDVCQSCAEQHLGVVY
jgi:hypothetical protein